MVKSNIDELAAFIATRRCALFAGAGLTVKYGGSTWDELINYLKEKFSYDSPLKDNFQIIGDMEHRYGPEKIYDAVKNRLKNATIKEPTSKLTELPWFTAFTTNYDTALEVFLDKNQKLDVRTILRGDEFALNGSPSELLCVKLMGSLDIPYGMEGAMILDAGDLAIAREARARIFDILTTNAANLSILFVGYSFSDGLFLEILDRLRKTIGQSKSTYYAVFQEEPDTEKAYLLKQYNVEVIVAPLEDFATELSEKVSLLNPEDFSKKRILLGTDVIPIDATKLVNFLSFFDPVLFQEMEEPVLAEPFLKGDTKSFKPFELGWHFQRKEIKDLISLIVKKKNNDNKSNIIRIEGNPGTGRTFIILAAINDLIRKHRILAIRVPSYSYRPIPSPDELSVFLKEVQQELKNRDIEEPRYVVFWAEFLMDDEQISQFKKLSAHFKNRDSDIDYPKYSLYLIFEGLKSARQDEKSSEKNGITSLDISSDLSKEIKEELKKYILQTTKDHKLPAITDEETTTIINEEKTFLPIMYRTLDPARRSINRIINETFNEIKNPIERTCISMCSLATSIDLKIPVAVLKRALSRQSKNILSYPDVFQIAQTKAGKAFIKESEDFRKNPLFSIYHSLVAQYVCKLIGPKKMDEHLLDIARTVELRSRIEGEFMSNLLIARGIKWEVSPLRGRPFSDDGLEKVFSELRKRQPARPILHHFALFYHKKNPMDKRIISLLKEALAEPREVYTLEEKKENVLTTLANVLWEQNKKKLLFKPREDPEIQEIIDILIAARENVSGNIPPYDVHARIIYDLMKHCKDFGEKMALMNEAVEVINQGLEECLDDPDASQRLNKLLIEIIFEIDAKKAKDMAEDLFDKNRDGTGYYTLATVEFYKNSQPVLAIKYLDKAMSADEYPPGAIALRVEIELLDSFTKYPNYDTLLPLVDKLSKSTKFIENWKSAYHKGVVYTIKGRYKDALEYFNFSRRRAPRLLQRKVRTFWMEGGHRKMLNGKIGNILTEREGRIYSHGIDGWKENIFFDPRHQELKHLLRKGLFVNFELGFSPLGPIAFDVRPKRITKMR